MSKGIVLSFFDFTGNIVRPWAESGYQCYCFDLKHEGVSREGNITRIEFDLSPLMRDFEYAYFWSLLKAKSIHRSDVVFTCYFPPCTDLAASGARWWKSKAEKDPDFQNKAMRAVLVSWDLGEYFKAPFFIENPVGAIPRLWRKWDYTFQPWQYGDPFTKKTCLWTGNGFRMPEPIVKNKPQNVDDRIHKMSKSPDRAAKRSVTPPGFANAIFNANANKHGEKK